MRAKTKLNHFSNTCGELCGIVKLHDKATVALINVTKIPSFFQ